MAGYKLPYYSNMPNDEYWKNRTIESLQGTLSKAGKVERYLDARYKQALKDILDEYYALMKPYRNDSDKGIDVDKINKDRMTNPQFRGKLIRCEEEFTYISRALGNGQVKSITDMLTDIVGSSYKSTMDTIGKKDYTYLLDKRTIDEIVKTPWTRDGKEFSGRIWSNVNNLDSQLRDTLTNGIIRGESIYKTADKLKERTGVSNSNCRRIVRTESVACHNKSALEAYKHAGIEMLDIIIEPDACGICKAKIKTIKSSEAIVGDTIPPYHPMCRCAVVGHFDD